jgi:hypothetical protein
MLSNFEKKFENFQKFISRIILEFFGITETVSLEFMFQACNRKFNSKKYKFEENQKLSFLGCFFILQFYNFETKSIYKL